MRLLWCCSAVSRICVCMCVCIGSLCPEVLEVLEPSQWLKANANIFNHFNTLLGNAVRATSDDFYVFYLTVNKHQ